MAVLERVSDAELAGLLDLDKSPDEGTEGLPDDTARAFFALIRTASTGTIKAMTTWARLMARSNIGYGQDDRWSFLDRLAKKIVPGQDGDCSSTTGAIAWLAGYLINLTGTFYTGNILSRLADAGWRVFRWAGMGSTREGDIICAPGHHVVYEVDGGKWWSAEATEKGGKTGGKSGNQNGIETRIRGKYDMSKGGSRSCYIARPPADPGSDLEEGDFGPAVTDLQTKLLATKHGAAVAAAGGADGDFGSGTTAAVVAVQTAAKIKPDGVVGSKTRAALDALLTPTPTPEPVPTPEPTPEPVGVAIRVATLNCLDPNIRQGYPAKLHPLTAARKAALVKVCRKAKADFYCLTEAPEPTRDAIRAGLPGGAQRWKVWERGAQAIVFDSHRWTSAVTDPGRVGWGYHGAVSAAFTGDGQTVTVGAYHLPPDSLTTKVAQQSLLADWLERVAKRPGAHIIGGDGMNSTDWAAGWTDARKAAAKSSTRDKPTYKTSITDRILSLGNVVWRGYTVHNAGVGSDHNLVVTAATVGGDLS